MATPNYGYEKRQRELAKRQKKEEKLRAKADRKSTDGTDLPADDSGSPDGALEPQAPAAPDPAASASR